MRQRDGSSHLLLGLVPLPVLSQPHSTARPSAKRYDNRYEGEDPVRTSENSSIPRTRVNTGMKEGRGCPKPRPSARDALAYRDEPHLLLGEGVARQVLCPHAHNGLVDTATLQVGARV